MKKIFTLLAVIAMSLSAIAENYKCGLRIIVSGQAPADYEEVDISCTKNDGGKYDIELKDFSFGEFQVGTINLADVDATESGDVVYLKTAQKILVMGLLSVNINLQGHIYNGSIVLELDIPEVYTRAILSSRATSLYGGDFEAWHKTGDYDEPNGWHGIKSGTDFAYFATNGVYVSDDIRTETTGKKSAKIQSTVTMGISANGTLTTGRMKVGSTTPSSSANCVFIDPTSIDVDGNGDPFYNKFEGFPVSISLWYKFQQGEGNSNNALVSATLLCEDDYYQEPAPADTQYQNIIATASQDLTPTTEWMQVTIPFTYIDWGSPLWPWSLLVTVNTCKVPGGGSTSTDNPDILYVDDVTLNYSNQLTGVSFFDVAVPNFKSDQYTYDVTVKEVPTEDDIDVTTEHYYYSFVSAYDEANKVMTLYSFSEDLKTYSTYKFNLTIDPSGVEAIKGSENLVVTGKYNLNGQSVRNTAKGLVITKYADGTVKKTLK